MIYASYIHDGINQLTVIGERTHGVSSLANGELEVMIHRNPDMSDDFGPGLTDTDVVFPTLRVLVDIQQNSNAQLHKQSYWLNFPVVVFTAPTTTASDWIKRYKTSAQFLTSALPNNIHLLSLNALDATSNKVILRLTHLFAIGEAGVFSQPVILDLSNLFAHVKITSLVETTLTANKIIDNPKNTTITISPKEIRTFIVGLGSA